MQGSSTTIVIADDHPLFRGALRQAIGSLMPAARVVEANGIDELNETLAVEKDVDLILLDLTMPGVQGFSGLISLRAQHPELPVVIVSANEEATVIRRAIEFGASGFIPKSLNVDAIGTAIAAVLAGDTWTPPDIDLTATEDKETADLVRRLATLTPQQVRVLMMLREGPCLGDPRQARGRQPHPGRHCRGQDRRDAAPLSGERGLGASRGKERVQESVDSPERLVGEAAFEAGEDVRPAGP